MVISRDDIIKKASKSFDPNKTKNLLNDLEEGGLINQKS
jgi:hypothetical protein